MKPKGIKLDYKCPECKFKNRNVEVVANHYGLSHKIIIKYLNEHEGILSKKEKERFCYDETILQRYLEKPEKTGNQICKNFKNLECPFCKEIFSDTKRFLKHLLEFHYLERIKIDLENPTTEETTDLMCNRCKKHKVFSTYEGLISHYSMMHSDLFIAPGSDHPR